jgi:NAD-dependent SIR2 family protein deacetylase
MVLTGAGVSVSCGIPDFRSKNGIYSRLAEFQLSDPQEMFDINYFRYSPETFYSFAKEIYPSNFQPSVSHHFVRKLEKNGKLLRNYSQNIDTLETKAGITNVINCHGSFKASTCLQCCVKYPIKHIEIDIFQKQVPYCKCGGVIKPDITFFGEGLPTEFHDNINQDMQKCDLLIVMGTSLKVQPVCNVVELVGDHVPQVLINRNRLAGRDGFDVELLGDCDAIISEIEKALYWNAADNVVANEEIFKGELGSEHWVWKFEGAVVDVDSSESESSSSSEPDSCEDDDIEVSPIQDVHLEIEQHSNNMEHTTY